MRIDLARTLVDAATMGGDPAPITVDRVLARARRARRIRLLRWGAGLLALVLLAGLAVWSTPRLSREPLPAPTPTPSSEYRWDGTDQLQTLFSDEEIARRCTLTATEKVSDNGGVAQPGQSVLIIPAKSRVTTDKDGMQIEPPGSRHCELGYDTTPTRDPVTAQEVAAPAAELPAICERHSGLSLTGDDWRLVAAVDEPGPDNPPHDQRLVAFASHSGWFTVCVLEAEASSNPPVTYQAVRTLQRLTDTAAAQEQPGCPQVAVYPRESDESSPAHPVVMSVGVGVQEPVMTGDRIDESITAIDVVGPRGWGLTAHIPVVAGIALADRHIRLARPMPLRSAGEMPVSTLQLRDASGRVVRTCTPRS